MRSRPFAALRGDKRQFEVPGCSVKFCLVDRRQEDRARGRCVEVDVAEQLEGGARRHFVNAVDLVGPVDLAAFQVELPATDPGQGAHALLQRGRALRRLAFGHTLADVHVRADDAHRRARRVTLDHHRAAEHPDPVAGPMAQARFALVECRLARQVPRQRRVQRAPALGVHEAAPFGLAVCRVLQGVAEHGAFARIRREPAAGHVQVPEPEVTAPQREFQQLGTALALGRRLHGEIVQLFGLLLRHPRAAAQLQQRRCLTGQGLERAGLAGIERARHRVDHADRAHRLAVGHDDRGARIKADVGLPGDERTGAKTRVVQRVLDDEDGLGRGDRMGAEGQVAVGLCGIQADPGLEPLPVLVDERQQCDRCGADFRGQLHDVVVDLLGQGVEDLQASKLGEPRCFVGGGRCGNGRHRGRPEKPGVRSGL